MCPFDYSLCQDTVTVYRKKDQKVLRQVLHPVMMNVQTRVGEGDGGAFLQRPCQIIHPGENICFYPGDRVFWGTGPEVSLEQWAGFIQENVEDLVLINYVRPWLWDGTVCHTEAGWK
jgi:hypothetical protein